MTTARLLVGDVFERMAELPDHSFDLILTSPPFLALRSYLPDGHPDKAKEIGSEATPAEYLDTLLELTAEWRRLLAPHGSIAVELGDTYAGSGGAGGDYNPDGLRAGQPKFSQTAANSNPVEPNKTKDRSTGRWGQRIDTGGAGWPLDKSLTGIPTLYTWSLAYGRNLLTGQPSPAGMWRIRNLKPWIRTNPPVGALGDKERPATSYITVATLARDRWFDLDAVRTAPTTRPQRFLTPQHHYNGGVRHDQEFDDTPLSHEPGNRCSPAGAPPLDWVHTVDLILDNELDTDEPRRQWTVENDDPDGPWFLRLVDSDLLDAVFHDESDARMVAATLNAQAASPRWWHHVDAILDNELDTRAGKTANRRTAKHVDQQARDGKSANRDGNWSSLPELAETNGSVGARGHHLRRALERAGILQTLDALDVSPKGYPGQHYAVFPMELVRRLIDEMCPRRVCTQCGQPSRRIVERTRPQEADDSQRVKHANGERPHVGRQDRAPEVGWQINRETVGWSDCGHNTWRPGHILDPFAGSGTTLAVATGMARTATGIDLDPRNADLARERCGMFLEIDDRTDEVAS